MTYFQTNLAKSPKDYFRVKAPAGDFGIEIETEGEHLPEEEVTKFFSGHPDGSLRHGMEYVSKVLTLAQVEGAVDDLALQLARAGAVINPSYRSSTHIHVNYATEPMRNVFGATVLWALVEPVVFRLLPPGRDGSLFCVPSYDCGELARSTDQLCQDIANGFVRGFRPRGKYSSLNLTRLGPGDAAALGSLEYRIFPSTMDGKTISTWCSYLYNMREVVRAAKDETFVSMVDHAEKNAYDFTKVLFPEVEKIDRQELNHLVDFGARTAYEMARMIRKHCNAPVKEERKKKDLPPGHLIIDDIQPVINWDEPVPQLMEAPVAPGGFFQRAEGGGLGAAIPRAGLARRLRERGAEQPPARPRRARPRRPADAVEGGVGQPAEPAGVAFPVRRDGESAAAFLARVRRHVARREEPQGVGF